MGRDDEFLPAERLFYGILTGGLPRSEVTLTTGLPVMTVGGNVEAWEQRMLDQIVWDIRISIGRQMNAFTSVDALCRRLCNCQARGRRRELRRHRLHPHLSRCPYVSTALQLAAGLEALRRGLPFTYERGATRERSKRYLHQWAAMTGGVPALLGIRRVIFRGGRWRARLGKGAAG